MRFAIQPSLIALALVASPCLAQGLPPGIYVPTNEDGFRNAAPSGFGDLFNSGASSMQWFKGDLYVGTTRAAGCVTLAGLASKLPLNLYPFVGKDCPPDVADLPLAAEIWRYSPGSGQWQRVYRSPLDIPVRFNIFNRPTKFTARDIAFPSMAVVKQIGGQEVLYVGGMSAAELFPGVFGAMAPPPPPRILRTINGADWQALPQTAGTLLGDLGKGLPGSQVKVVSFDTLVGHGGRLFATIGDSLGNRAILASSDPTSGDNAWQLASPPPESFPVGALTVYNGFLYCVVSGKPGEPYRVFKADAEGTAPLTFSPVMTGGGDSAESMPAGRGISFAEFKGRLYLGTGTPPELVRIDADDSWELLVGQPRLIDGQLKRPLTGVTPGLGSAFSAQFRSLAVHEGKLYVGTSDWSQALEIEPSLAEIAQLEFSFDLFRSDDGFAWTPVTRNGFGVSHQPIAQTMQSTPAGLFVGGASFREGSRVWQRAALPKPTAAAAPPERLEAVSEELSDDSVVLSWEPSAGAVRYRVYRAPVVPLLDVLSGGVATLSSPQESASVGNLIQGLCDAIPLVCALFTALQSDLGVPGPFTLIGTATDPFFLDERVSALPALYFVRAEDAAGQVSRISNMAGGPSRAALLTFPGLQTWLDAAAQKQASKSRTRISKLFQRAQTAAEAGNLPDSERLLLAAEKGVQQGPLWQRVPATEAQDLTHLLQGLHRNVWLGERELIPLESVLEGLP